VALDARGVRTDDHLAAFLDRLDYVGPAVVERRRSYAVRFGLAERLAARQRDDDARKRLADPYADALDRLDASTSDGGRARRLAVVGDRGGAGRPGVRRARALCGFPASWQGLTCLP
jgi:hypothetical protein